MTWKASGMWFERAREYARPCVVHVHTTKGMGYRPAMENPSKYHGVSPFDLKSGLPLKPSDPDFPGPSQEHL